MTTLVAGVIVAGVGVNAQPHNLREHVDVALSTPSDGDIIRYDTATGLWKKTAPTTLPVGSHNHDGVYVKPADITSLTSTLAPKNAPSFTGDVTVSSTAPTLKLNETDSPYETWDNRLHVNSGGMYLRMNGYDSVKLESIYSLYSGVSFGLPVTYISSNVTISNPGGVYYVDATSGNVTVTLGDVADHYRTVSRQTGIIYYIVRKDNTANTVTIVPQVGQTIDGATSITISGADSHAVLQGTDSGWRKILFFSATASGSDSGWQTSQWENTAFTSASHYGFSPVLLSGAFRFRRINNIVYLDGWRTTGSSTAISAGSNVFRLPSTMYPSKTITFHAKRFTAVGDGVSCTFQVKTDGYVSSGGNIGTSTTLDIGGCSIVVD